jgi:DNA-binding response OmpR family regulator
MQRVLVIHDDPAATRVFERGLVYEGYSVDTAATAMVGLAIAHDHVPDLLILGVMLPGTDGHEMVRLGGGPVARHRVRM